MNTKTTLTREIKRSTQHFIEYIKKYAEEIVDYPYSEGKWNIVQIIEHVILTDKTIIGLLQHPFLKHKNGHYSKYQLRDILLNRTVRMKNPERVTPLSTQDKSITEWLKDFEIQRTFLITQIETDKVDLDSEEAYPHFRLSLLTRRDWLYLICFHSDRHIAQIQELLFCK